MLEPLLNDKAKRRYMPYKKQGQDLEPLQGTNRTSVPPLEDRWQTIHKTFKKFVKSSIEYLLKLGKAENIDIREEYDFTLFTFDHSTTLPLAYSIACGSSICQDIVSLQNMASAIC